MKICTQCGEEKSLDDFYLQKKRSGNKVPMSHCKACHNIKVAKRVQEMTPAQREIYLEMMWARQVRLKYGITVEDYDLMLAEQGGVCKICKRPETSVRNGKVRRMPVDHDHDTGEVRGLLCMLCNSRLGYFEHHGLMDSLLGYLGLKELA